MTFPEAWDKHHDEYIEFGRVQNKRSRRPDLHAFLLLDELVPGDRDIVAAAAHDQIFLGVDVDELSAVASEDQMVELIRCGVMYDCDSECLHMFS